MNTRILVVEHEPDDPPAQFGDWLAEYGVDLDVVQAWAGSPLPASLAVEDKPRAYLLEAAVQEDQQRQGIGRWLVQRTCNEFSARGFAAIIAHATHQQAAAQSVLRQAGFEELSFRGYTFERQSTG